MGFLDHLLRGSPTMHRVYALKIGWTNPRQSPDYDHGCQDSGKPGKPGKLLELKTWPGKPGKPGKLLEFFYFFPEKYFLAKSVYFRYYFSKSEKMFVQSLKFFGADAPVPIFHIHYSIEKPFLREKISWNFLKIWPGKPGKLLEFLFWKVLTTIIGLN